MKQFQYLKQEPPAMSLLLTAILFLTPSFSFADDTFSPDSSDQDGKATVQDDVETPSLMRQYLWTGSLDRAGDATRNAEIDLKNMDVDCSKIEEKYNNDPRYINYLEYCHHLQERTPELAQDAESIRRQQRVLANVSHLTGVAAVGSVGTMLYTEMGMKDSNQSSSLAKVARIQKKAGYVNYAAGATDLAIGAYTYASQAKKLESIKDELTGQGKLYNTAGSSAISSLNSAIAKTKSAAYSHMFFGAGKMAAGYASIYMSKQNKKQADNLASYETQMYYNQMNTPYPMPTISQPPVNGGAPYYQNNQPSFAIAGSSTNTDSTNSNSTGTDPYATSGASIMPHDGITRNLASSKNGGVSTGGNGGANPSLFNATGESASNDTAADAQANKQAEALSGFEISLSGGGASRYTGSGSSHDAGKSDSTSLNPSFVDNSVGTGVNPNEVYKNAVSDVNQGALENGGEQSLFDAIRAKHMKMVEMGRVMGPPPVEVKTN